MIEFRGVTKRYAGADVAAVDNLSLQVYDGEIAVFVGPSGCGKTTSMKMVNRLIEPSEGEILIDGRNNRSLDEVQLRRGIGYAIQQIGLFPHRTIAENVAVVPRLLKWDKARIRGRVDEMLDLVGLDPDTYRARYPAELSGGQQQRVGVARALAADPPVMLMDEPFGAVDPIARQRLQNEFLEIQSRVRKTIIFVTHDIDEAIVMGDRIAVLRQGGILAQYDRPETLLTAPSSEFVASFVGEDRAIKRLSLARCCDAVLDPARDLRGLPAIQEQETLRDALAVMLAAGTDRALVVADEGKPRGEVSLGTIRALFAAPSERERAVQ